MSADATSCTAKRMKRTDEVEKQSATAQVCMHEGDLFTDSDPEAALVHCVSRDLRMGRGIATTFRDMFGPSGIRQLEAQQAAVGGVAVLSVGGGRLCFNLVSKERYWHKPTYDSLRLSLRELRRQCESHGVTRVAMPRIGCGLDRLHWDRVLPMIEELLVGVAVDVYQLAVSMPAAAESTKKK